jgi:hypothetical protein
MPIELKAIGTFLKVGIHLPKLAFAHVCRSRGKYTGPRILLTKSQLK